MTRFDSLDGFHRSSVGADNPLGLEASHLLNDSSGRTSHNRSENSTSRSDTGNGATANRTPLELDEQGAHIVARGESLSVIAFRELRRRGATVNGASLKHEIQRIVDANLDKFPGLKDHPERIRAGWKLQIWDQTLGPEPSVKWKPWATAESGKMTVVRKGERMVAPEGSWLIVEPGAEAILNPGSKAFLSENAKIVKALPGSMVLAVGGTINDYGAKVQIASQGVRINKIEN